MSPDEAVRLFRDELDRTNSPLPVAAALGVLGINPFNAAEHQLRFVLEVVQASDLLSLTRATGSGSGIIPKPLPVEKLLDELHRSPKHHADPMEILKPGRLDSLTTDRIAALKQLFIHRA